MNGLDDWTEVFVRSTDPNKVDTDGDGFWDLGEIQAGNRPRMLPAIRTPWWRLEQPLKSPSTQRPEHTIKWSGRMI